MTPKKAWIAYQTLVWKELVRIFRIWPQTLVPPAITMALYFLIFGKLVGAQIRPLGEFTYMQYIVPGLVMMSLITNSYIHASSSFFIMKFQKSIEEILVSPMSNVLILAGFLTGALIRSLLVAFIVSTVALFFTHLTVHHWGYIFFVAFIASIFFATLGLINAIFARNFDDISWVPSFVITPLTYLGGVFFSIHMLSGVWQKIALLDPVFYIIDVFRYGMLGVHDTNVAVSMLVLTTASLVLCVYALYLIRTNSRLRS